MLVTVRLFARLREIAGASALARDLPDGATARTAWESIARDFPALEPYQASVACAVNADYAPMTAPLHDGDEIAFLPPVSGGTASGPERERRVVGVDLVTPSGSGPPLGRPRPGKRQET